jgi:hypothetical protein
MLGHLLLVAALQAATPSADPPPPPQKSGDVTVVGKRDPGSKRVCKRSVSTGSIMPSMTCRTADEWEQKRVKELAAIEKVKDEEEARQAAQEARKGM